MRTSVILNPDAAQIDIQSQMGIPNSTSPLVLLSGPDDVHCLSAIDDGTREDDSSKPISHRLVQAFAGIQPITDLTKYIFTMLRSAHNTLRMRDVAAEATR